MVKIQIGKQVPLSRFELDMPRIKGMSQSVATSSATTLSLP
jgi:hypothetical protein